MTKNTALSILTLLATAALATACGNKGPLFLPQQPPASQQRPAPPAPTDDQRVVTPPDPANEPTQTNDDPAEQATAPKPPKKPH